MPGRDSALGYGISLQEIDLSRLMGGNHFTVPCTISYNGFRVDSYALADTRANGFAFIDTACAIDVAKFLDIKTT